MVNSLFVDLNDERVGKLILNRGEMRFEYAEEWLRSPLVRSLSRSLPVTQRVHEGKAVEDYFGNLLPDNPETLKRIAGNLRLGTLGVFEILEAIGGDCVGAVRLYPAASGERPASESGYRLLDDSEIERILSELTAYPLGLRADDDFRISVAGAQQKTAFLKRPKGWALPLGTMPTTHIFKTPIGSLQGNTVDFSESCENEWLCLEIARAFGLSTASAELHRFGSQKALVVERFDRILGRLDGRILRRLTEDCCQALSVPAHLKYEADGGPGIAEIMALLSESADPETDRRTFMAAQVLMWLLNSTDGHAKNYSVLVSKNDVFRLAPLYDILSAEPLAATGGLNGRKLKLAMGLSGKNRHCRTAEIEPRHFISTAEAVDFPTDEMRGILRMFAEKTEEVVKEVRSRLPEDFPAAVSEPIFTLMAARAAKIAVYLRVTGG